YLLYTIGIVTVLLTAFYTMRMLGITFAGKPSSNVEEVERRGGHVHESGPLMFVPYLLLAIASLGLGLFYPFYSERLTNYLAGTFKSLPASFTVGTVPALTSIDILLLAASTGMAVIGLVLGYLLYFRRSFEVRLQMGVLRSFLWHRWYIDAVYYRVFVNGLTAGSRGLYRYIEQGIWDRLSSTVARDVIDYTSASGTLDSGVVDRGVNDVASAGSRLSNLLRRLQNGVTEQYIITFAIGIILLLVYMIFVIGAR
ncbi:hypothetical protein J2P12_08765, partial [Candidatus Bathyarchaeota archaeon]|nr:hypothetical protein [Candidatus Bathyarchaeota archaeon]